MICFPVPHPEYEALRKAVASLQEEIVRLLCRRDHLLLQESPQIETEYRLKIGALECKVFEFQCRYLRIRRKLELVQAALNRREEPDFELIERTLNLEQGEFESRLLAMKEKVEQALKYSQTMGELSKSDAEKVKKLYFEIVWSLHPDLNPNPTATEKTLLQAAMKAFETGNIVQLEAIAASIKKIDPDSDETTAFDELEDERDRLSEIRSELSAEIKEIETSFPFDQISFLRDAEAVEKRRKELDSQLDRYAALFGECKKRLDASQK